MPFSAGRQNCCRLAGVHHLRDVVHKGADVYCAHKSSAGLIANGGGGGCLWEFGGALSHGKDRIAGGGIKARRAGQDIRNRRIIHIKPAGISPERGQDNPVIAGGKTGMGKAAALYGEPDFRVQVPANIDGIAGRQIR